MNTDRTMSDAELRVVREHLGLPQEWLAEHLGVVERTIRRWETGTQPIPDGVRVEIERLEEVTAELVGRLVEQLLDRPGDEPVVTYRSDAEYRAHHPDTDWPASWHRRVIARVAEEVPELAMIFYEPGVDQEGREV